jgi:hypothetical protein
MSSSWTDGLWRQPCATPTARMYYSSWRTKARTPRASASVRAAAARGSTARSPRAPHGRPFLVPKARPGARRSGSARCNGEVRRGLFLVHDFRTDLLLLRGSIPATPSTFQPEQPWLYDALATLAEAPRARCQPAPRYRSRASSRRAFDCCLPLVDGDHGASPSSTSSTPSSGGAGYAADAGAQLQDVLDRTEKLLESCPANRARGTDPVRALVHEVPPSLRQPLPARSPRSAARACSCLRYFRTGEVPAFASAKRTRLACCVRWPASLELEGWTTAVDYEWRAALRRPSNDDRRESTPRSSRATLPRRATQPRSPRRGTARHPPGLPRRARSPLCLPARNRPHPPRMRHPRPRPAAPAPPPKGRAVELPVKDLRRGQTRTSDPRQGAVARRHRTAADDAFAVRVPNPGLPERRASARAAGSSSAPSRPRRSRPRRMAGRPASPRDSLRPPALGVDHRPREGAAGRRRGHRSRGSRCPTAAPPAGQFRPRATRSRPSSRSPRPSCAMPTRLR